MITDSGACKEEPEEDVDGVEDEFDEDDDVVWVDVPEEKETPKINKIRIVTNV